MVSMTKTTGRTFHALSDEITFNISSSCLCIGVPLIPSFWAAMLNSTMCRLISYADCPKRIRSYRSFDF